MNPLDGMTQAKWDALTRAQREAIVDLSNLSPQLLGKQGWRVEVIRMDGTRDRFIVGRSTGWRPCHLELRKRTSMGGISADKAYRSVVALEQVE